MQVFGLKRKVRGIEMKKRNMVITFAAFFLLGTFFFSSVANAYIDPSAMTYIVQVIVGIVIAGGAAAGFYFKKMKRAIKKKGNKAENLEVKKANFNIDDDDDDEFDDSNITGDEFYKMNGKK